MKASIWKIGLLAIATGIVLFSASITEARSVVTIGNYSYVCPNTCVVRTYSSGMTIHDSNHEPIHIVRLDGGPVPVQDR